MLNVFITGASSGIGAALARQYAAGGATVGLVARNAEKLQAVVESLPGDPKRHFAFPADVTKREEIFEAAARFEKIFRRRHACHSQCGHVARREN